MQAINKKSPIRRNHRHRPSLPFETNDKGKKTSLVVKDRTLINYIRTKCSYIDRFKIGNAIDTELVSFTFPNALFVMIFGEQIVTWEPSDDYLNQEYSYHTPFRIHQITSGENTSHACKYYIW